MKKQPEHVFTSVYLGLSNKLINEVSIQSPSRDGSMYLSSNRFAALWDTGACGSVINSEVVARLGLMPSGTTEVFTANGLALQEIFDISIYLPGGLLIDCEVTCAELTTGHFSCLIGMDVIGKGDFAISNFEGKTVFSFRYPSLETIDFRE